MKDGKPSCVKCDDGSSYNLKMPMFDAAGHKIGILVMEVPYTSAPIRTTPYRQAESLRAELAHHIPHMDALFK